VLCNYDVIVPVLEGAGRCSESIKAAAPPILSSVSRSSRCCSDLYTKESHHLNIAPWTDVPKEFRRLNGTPYQVFQTCIQKRVPRSSRCCSDLYTKESPHLDIAPRTDVPKEFRRLNGTPYQVFLVCLDLYTKWSAHLWYRM